MNIARGLRTKGSSDLLGNAQDTDGPRIHHSKPRQSMKLHDGVAWLSLHATIGRRTELVGRSVRARRPHRPSERPLCRALGSGSCLASFPKWGQQWPAALWIPSEAAAGRRKSPQGGRQGCRPVWRQGRMPCRQTPQPGRGLSGRDARKARKRGGLLFGYFLLATQEKVARPPKEGETLLILKRNHQQAGLRLNGASLE
jgi:hypothetical protein